MGIVALSVLAAVVSGLIVWLITRHFDRQKASTAIVEARSQPQLQPPQLTPTPSSLQAVATQKPRPSSQATQQTKVKVTGNDNVAGNNVVGSGNVVGNDNKVSGPTVSAPNGNNILDSGAVIC